MDSYLTPQLFAAAHKSRVMRFFRRAIDTSGGTSASPLASIMPEFWPQRLLPGELRTVTATFYSPAGFTATGATFTLRAAGAAIAGYNGISAAVASSSNSRVWTASAEIDLTPEALHALSAGVYDAEFLISIITDSADEVVGASGEVIIDSLTPLEDITQGGGIE